MTTIAGSSFRLRVLGAPSLVDDGGETPTALGWGKPLALLCYLAVRGEVRRDEIVDLLWRDVPEHKARNAFRQALHRLRTALGDELIPHDRDRLRLATSDRLSIDVMEFERHASVGRHDDAIALYGGDFLDGVDLREPPFDHWAEQERTRLRARFRQVLEEAALEASGRGDWTEAIARGKRLLNLVPFEAAAAKLAATTLLSAGRRFEALELLRQFSERTRAELGIAVRADIQDLIDRLARETPDATPGRAQTAAAREASLPFVGRESELSRLIALWQTVGEDSGAIALIEGEAGIGKTRLAQELIAHARSIDSALVVTGRERSAGAQLPFGVFGEALRPLVRARGVGGASAHLLAEAARLLPELRDVIDLPQVSAIEDEASRLRFFEGVAALIDAAAYEQALLVVLEELQYMPPSSLDLMSYLAARLGGTQVMFVLTLRPSVAPQHVLSRLRALAGVAASGEEGARDARALRLTLAPITIERAIDAIREGAMAAGLSAATAERLARQSGGNPFRLEQGLRGAAAGGEVGTTPVPMRDLLHERLQRLSSTQRRIFLVLAMLGRAVPAELLAAASHVSDASCREAVRVLEQLGLLERVEPETFVANHVAADIASDSAGNAGRAFLAGWIADALALDPTTASAELARLYATAGNASRAFGFARRAAFDALATGARVEAAQLFAIARTFAASAEEQAEMEAVLDALGTGRRRLAKGTEREQAAPVELPPASHSDAGMDQPAVSVDPAAALPTWQRLFPHWRMLLGAAVATLSITAVVLGTRLSDANTSASRSADTLVVSEGGAGNARSRRLAVGGLASGFTLGPRFDAGPSEPPWIDSLAREWTHPLPAPRGRHVAIARLTPGGADLVVISNDRRDTVTLLANQGSATPLAWSPDGRWLLASRGRSGRGGGGGPHTGAGAFDAALFAFHIDGQKTALAIDSTPGSAVTEALWSPDGSHIAWVARVGAQRQQDVFTSLADGSGARNVSRHPAEDYHIAWSPNGELLAFTSTRDSNPELYAADLVENRLWRLTHNIAHDDAAAFSPDGRSVAFESTRRGLPSVYVMPALGGEAQLVGLGGPLEFVDWRGHRSQYLDYVRVLSEDVPIGDSTRISLRGFDEEGDVMPVENVEWRILDTAIVRFSSPDSEITSASRTLVGVREGLARVVATVGHWRADTTFIRVGSSRIAFTQAEFANGFSRWRHLGASGPTLDRRDRSVLLHANREWESGLLSRDAVPLMPGLSVLATVAAPWNAPPDAATEVSLALVAPEDDAVIDSLTPQFLRLASVVWKADAGRIAYVVGKEVFSEPVAASPAGDRRFAMVVESDGTVTFLVDERPRWRSTLRVVAPRLSGRAKVWVSGRATGDQVRISGLAIALAARVDGAQPRR